MQDQRDQKIEKVITVAINIIKVLVIIYLGFVEVFKIGKLLREKLDLNLIFLENGLHKIIQF